MNYLASRNRLLLLTIILLNFGFRLWSIDRGSLWDVHIDELPRVSRAIYVASTGEFNHGYFNHPSSTVIYPLAFIYHLWGIITFEGEFLQANPRLSTAYQQNPGEFFLLGRYLIAALTTAGVPLFYHLGQRAFNSRVSLLGTAWWVIIPGITFYSQVVRDDMAAIFFNLLSLWLCLKLVDQPSTRLQILAGSAIGLAIATRYFMAALGPVLVAGDALLLWRYRALPHQWRPFLLKAGLGLVCIILAFIISTPYFLIDLSEVQADLAFERRTTHVGGDGLSPLGNFTWYLTYAIPGAITSQWAILALIGLALTLFKLTAKQALLLGFSLFFLVFISLQALHWDRWVLPIAPILILYAANGLDHLSSKLSGRLRLAPAQQNLILTLVFIGLAIVPTTNLVQQLMRQSNPSTRALAREWSIQNLPAQSKVLQESGTALTNNTPLEIHLTHSLPTTNYTVDQVYSKGYKYIIVNMDMYQRYANEKERYKGPLNMYHLLFEKGILLQEFNPSPVRDGPVIKIYALPATY